MSSSVLENARQRLQRLFPMDTARATRKTRTSQLKAEPHESPDDVAEKTSIQSGWESDESKVTQKSRVKRQRSASPVSDRLVYKYYDLKHKIKRSKRRAYSIERKPVLTEELVESSDNESDAVSDFVRVKREEALD